MICKIQLFALNILRINSSSPNIRTEYYSKGYKLVKFTIMPVKNLRIALDPTAKGPLGNYLDRTEILKFIVVQNKKLKVGRLCGAWLEGYGVMI